MSAAAVAPEGLRIGRYYYRPPGHDYAYTGERRPDGAAVVVERKGKRRPLHHVAYHSASFEWGYEGSGPADLALSILCHALGERPATRRAVEECAAFGLYQQFKRDLIAGLARDRWSITSTAVWRWLSKRSAGPEGTVG
jgi:hypothetical protein